MRVNENNDAELIERYKSGDDTAFEELLYKYKNQVFGYILKMVRNKAMAEDVFQNVWLNVIKYLPRYDERNKFPAFLFKIAYSKTMDYLRKDKYFVPVFENIPDTSNLNSQNEMYDSLKIAISKLPEKQKEILLLRQESNLTFKEIAKLLDCPINTVLARMHNAVLSLRKMLKKEV